MTANRAFRLLSIGGDTIGKHNQGCVYMHLMWKSSQVNSDGSYYNYVGQTLEREKRIMQHLSPDFQKNNPCLHYHILRQEDIKKQFFILAELPTVTQRIQSRTMNFFSIYLRCGVPVSSSPSNGQICQNSYQRGL